ncbi:MAG: MBL fold metallo-hydrolase [Candidatus Magasanikbacteria bacterium]|nr:MBL fold metallo-hydrolase [Candidatus Magasanikbacteria bacterium]
MHISWLGTTAVKLQAKPFDKDITIVIDTYKPKAGNFPRSLTPDIALFTHGEKERITLSGTPFIMSSPGEIDTKGILVTAVEGQEPGHILFRIDAEQLSIGHLGLINKPLSEKQLEILSDVDVLLIPVGHPDSFDEEMAVKVVNSIEPRIVIPLAYKSDNDLTSKSVLDFLKEIGSKNGEPEKKVIIKKKDLPQDETQVIVLEKE